MPILLGHTHSSTNKTTNNSSSNQASTKQTLVLENNQVQAGNTPPKLRSTLKLITISSIGRPSGRQTHTTWNRLIKLFRINVNRRYSHFLIDQWICGQEAVNRQIVKSWLCNSSVVKAYYEKLVDTIANRIRMLIRASTILSSYRLYLTATGNTFDNWKALIHFSWH